MCGRFPWEPAPCGFEVLIAFLRIGQKESVIKLRQTRKQEGAAWLTDALIFVLRGAEPAEQLCKKYGRLFLLSTISALRLRGLGLPVAA
jgi:hypothetical protein